MDLYTLKVDSFSISNTRSVFNDTLHLAYAAFVDGDKVAQRVGLDLGDLGNGNYDLEGDPRWALEKGGLAGVVINDPMAKVAFNFQLVNASNVPAGALSGRVSATADQLAGIAAGLGGWGLAIGIALEAFANFYAWAQADCDGPVAVDQISGPRYVLDALLDTDTDVSQVQGGQVQGRSQTGAGLLQITNKLYQGVGAQTGCHADSFYTVSWSFQHSREWVRITDELPGPAPEPLPAAHGVGATAHNGGVYALGTDGSGNLLAARSFTGESWKIVPIGSVRVPDSPGGAPSLLPVSAVSFNDRLYVLGISTDGNIRTFYYTSDGGSWTPFGTLLPGFNTDIGIATTVFGHRLRVIAKDSTTAFLRITSTDDLLTWDPWTDIPQPQFGPPSALPVRWTAISVAAATLADTLHIFAVYSASASTVAASTGAPAPGTSEKRLLHNSMPQGGTWTGWQRVEQGTKLQGGGMPLDVAAVAFEDRIYIASRWDTVQIPLPTGGTSSTDVIAINFSEDGDNWSGWRIPLADHPGVVTDPAAGATAALAGLGNHLYIFAPPSGVEEVWVY
jgi:hypothetical protein